MSADPIQRGRRWQAFYHEDGGLNDMFDQVSQTYLARLSHVNPWDTDQLQILALAQKINEQYRGMVQAIVSGADVAQAAKEWTTKMQALPQAKRRRL